MRLLPALLYFIPATVFGQLLWQPITAEDTLITVTYQDVRLSKKARLFKGRVQLLELPGSDYSIVVAHQFDRLPSAFKRIKAVTLQTSSRFNRQDMADFNKEMMDSSVKFLASNPKLYPGLSKESNLLTTYPRNQERYFEGKSGGPFFEHNWIPLYAIESDHHPVTVSIKGTFFKKARYRTETLPAGFAPRLPVLDTTRCSSIDRFHVLRKMKGYGIDKFRYIPYRAPEREPVRHTFEIYFNKKSAEADVESLQPVVDFLKANNYSILNATIEAYSSPEGSEELNTYLQRRRAAVLVAALQRYNNEIILTDTVIINHGYDLFRQSIRPTAFRWLDTLSNENLCALINSNQILQSAVEPYLRLQRKATLKLVVAKRLEGEELFSRFKRDFDYWEKQLLPGRSNIPPAEVEARLMGLLEYLFGLVQVGNITSHQAAEILDRAICKQIIRVLSVYHLIIQFERKSQRDSLDWEILAKKYNYNELFSVAQANLISLITNPGEFSKQHEKFRQQLVDIQTYSFDYVRYGWLSVDALCNMDYPDSPKFRAYKLYQLAFLQHISRYMEVPCEKLRLPEMKEFARYSDDWLDEVRSNNIFTQIHETGWVKTRHLPSYGPINFSPLFFYLKKFYLSKETSIRQHIITSDNLYEFDLFNLIAFNVANWKPLVNYWEDEEVQLEDLDKLVSLLKTINKRICRPRVNELYLNYHLKALQYIDWYYEPGNKHQTRIAQQSLKFISEYYERNSGLVTARLSIYLMKQFNAFHWIPGSYDGTWYAWNTLKAISRKRELSEEEKRLLSKYSRFYGN
jgi:hypothetical protein